MSSNNLDKPNISKPLKKINKSNELATSSESNESTKLTKPTTSQHLQNQPIWVNWKKYLTDHYYI